jgi:HSP20 family molecular chaperone IbpA
MNRATVELMREEVRAIFHAVTGTDMPEVEAAAEAPGEAGEAGSAPVEEVARRFADLEARARTIPEVLERVPPFSFTPPLDVIEGKDEILITLAAPGVDRDDVTVDLSGDGVVLVISGVRRGDAASDGRAYVHAEIPRGPFQRTVLLSAAARPEPRVDLDRGLIRIQLRKAAPGA